MSHEQCRWGILSTAGIARKNWHSILNSGNGILRAVASRSLGSAQAFIRQCQASVPLSHSVDATGSYDELLHRTDIDAVYIPLPTGVREEWVIRAARAGKHVLVEKPCGINATAVRAMIDVCAEQGVQFMDGVMFMHSARMSEIRRVLDDGVSVGPIRRIVSQFSFCAPEDWTHSNIRTSSDLEPAGCLGDLGWYTIRIALWAMNYQMPTEVRGRTLHEMRRNDGQTAVPAEFQGELLFADGVTAAFYNSFRTNHQQWVNISGARGYLHVNDFVLPYLGNELSFEVASHNLVFDGCRFNMERWSRRPGVREYSNNMPNSQEARMFRTFAELVLTGRRDPEWPAIALQTQQVLDAALKSAQLGGAAVNPE